MEHNQISDITPLCKLTNLEWLNIRDNQIVDISPLAKLTKLKTLGCRDNQINNILPIRDLINLTLLDLDGNQIDDVSSLAKMTKLKTLVLWDNKVETILPLLKLTNLETLNLGRNRIHKISGIFRLTKLKTLNLRDNQINNIRAMRALKKLSFSDIRGNPIDRRAYRTDLPIILRNNPGCELLSDKINTQTLQNSFSSRDISSKKAVLIIASNNFRDEELFETRATFEKATIQTVIASTNKGIIKGMLGGTTTAELLVEDIVVDDYDVIVFVGGPGVREFFGNQTTLDIARMAVRKKKLLAAICIAPTILANAGVLNDVKATSAPSQKATMEKAGATYTGATVEQDGFIITGDGPKSSGQFSKAIVNAMLVMY
jgi:protease I